MTTRKFWLMKGLGMGLLMVCAIVLMGIVMMALWNALMPEIFGLIEINIWQAYGLLLLSKLLFGRFGKGRSSGGKWGNHWKHRMKEKWENMSPEERVVFKQKMKHGWKQSMHNSHCDDKDFSEQNKNMEE